MHVYNHSTLCMLELEIGKLAFSFSYLPNHRRMHPENGFFGRFGVYWDSKRVIPPL